MNFTITELESYLNLIQNLIDETLRQARINNPKKIINPYIKIRLKKLNKQKDIIIEEIEKKIDEAFPEKN